MCGYQRTFEKIPVVMAEGYHLYPYRTQKLSPPALMVLGWQRPGRVGRCRINVYDERSVDFTIDSAFVFFIHFNFISFANLNISSKQFHSYLQALNELLFYWRKLL